MLRRHPRVVAGVLATVVLAVVVGLLGGWERVESGEVQVVAAGEVIDVAPFRVRLDRAEAAYDLDGDLADPGLAYVLVEGELSLTVPESVGISTLDALVATDLGTTYDYLGEPTERIEIEVVEDGSALLGLGPDLTYRVRFVHRVQEAAVPDQVTVTLAEHVRREFVIDGTLGWLDPAPAARVVLDVVPLPDERPAPEDQW